MHVWSMITPQGVDCQVVVIMLRFLGYVFHFTVGLICLFICSFIYPFINQIFFECQIYPAPRLDSI